MCEIEIPDNLSDKLKKRIQRFVNDVLEVRLANPSFEEGDTLFEECRTIMSKIDEEIFGFKVTIQYP